MRNILFSVKIRSRRVVTRPSRVSPSSRCPSGWRFAAVARYQASCSWSGSASRNGTIDRSECREVPAHCFSDWQLVPYFVDALLGISVFFSGSCLLCWCALDALDRGMVYRPLEEGRGGWAVGRTLDAFVDALGARKEVFDVQGAAEGQGCRI